MPKYVVIGTYTDDAVAKREPYRAEHLSRLQALKDDGKVVTIGPTKDVTKLFGILEVASEAEARRLIEEDPYWTGGIWTSYELHEW
ncbi:MAG: YciI family protein, partial [Nitrospinota bacterium]